MQPKSVVHLQARAPLQGVYHRPAFWSNNLAVFACDGENLHGIIAEFESERMQTFFDSSPGAHEGATKLSAFREPGERETGYFQVFNVYPESNWNTVAQLCLNDLRRKVSR